MRVLIVEDEAKLAGIVRRGLRAAGHAADVAGSGEDALWMAAATGYSAIVLDVMLPGIDGVEACRRLRARGIRTPVLMLTARGASTTGSAGSTAAPTTTWSSRSRSTSSSRACAPSRRRRTVRPPPRSR